MGDERKMSITKAVAMNGGSGPYSYSQNSSYQKGVAVAAMEIIKEALPSIVDLDHLCSSSPNPIIRIADFGCSTGLTSIQAIETIIQCLLDLIKPTEQPQFRTLEFQAILNDLPPNDFNTLFANLLTERRRYYVAAAPGSFHGRLLPSASLNLAYSFFALHWLSRVPQEILDKSSRAWNGERIHYVGSPPEVVGAYAAQFGRDIEAFLNARAEEMVGEGVIFMVLPGKPDLVPDSQTTTGLAFELLGSCLMDMAKAPQIFYGWQSTVHRQMTMDGHAGILRPNYSNKGTVSKAKVESFNLPIYFPSETELKQAIGRNRFFDVERIQTLHHLKVHAVSSTPESFSLSMRAPSEVLLIHHFGDGLIIDDLFHRFSLEVAKSPFFLKPESHETATFSVVLKRKKYEENMQ